MMIDQFERIRTKFDLLLPVLSIEGESRICTQSYRPDVLEGGFGRKPLSQMLLTLCIGSDVEDLPFFMPLALCVGMANTNGAQIGLAEHEVFERLEKAYVGCVWHSSSTATSPTQALLLADVFQGKFTQGGTTRRFTSFCREYLLDEKGIAVFPLKDVLESCAHASFGDAAKEKKIRERQVHPQCAGTIR